MTYEAPTPVDECIAPATAVAYTAQAPEGDVGAPEPPASCAAAASFVTFTPLEVILMSSASAAERARLQRDVYEASAERAAQELLEDEAASASFSAPSSPVSKNAKRGKHKR